MNIRNLTALLLLWTGTCLHAKVDVLARFEPSRIAVGSTAKYIVEITDSDTNAMSFMEQIHSLPIPPVSGMNFRNGQASTSQKTSILNGRAEYTITKQIVIDTIPAKTGSFTIPSYSIDYKNTRLLIPTATLNVVERSANETSTANDLIFLKLDAPKKLYVGQAKQTTIQLYLADSVKINDYIIEPNADGFITTGGPPDEPTQSIEIVNNRRYRVYSWPLTITPVSSGKQELNFQSTLIAQFPSQRNTRNSPFSNSIFDDLFIRNERVNVDTTPTQIDVLSLPKEGQPENFSGAIGQFNISASTDAESTRVSEPIMLSLKISGQGNFSRIQGPEFFEADGWRSYQPESVFEANTKNELRGIKRFDYVFVPEKAGTLKLPEVRFSFFDPDVEKYVELSSPGITIKVDPSNVPAIAPPTLSNTETSDSTSPPDDLKKSLTAEELLITLDYKAEEGRPLSAEPIFKPSFYWINAGIFTIFMIATLLSYRTKHRLQSPHYKLIQDASKKLKTTLNKTKNDDADVFFSNAQKAIRLAATIRTQSNLNAADFATLETHFRQTGLTETIIDQARTLFQIADAYKFSSHHQTFDLSESRKQLKTVLKAL